VAFAAQKDVRDIALYLEDGAHEPRQMLVDLQNLLKLVEYEGDAPMSIHRDVAG